MTHQLHFTQFSTSSSKWILNSELPTEDPNSHIPRLWIRKKQDFFCLKPQRTYGLVTEPSSNVRTSFTNCTQIMLVWIGGYNPPCIYALLPNKTEKTYHDLTQALLQLIPNADPERIMMDFEKAAVNAFSTTFPAAQVTACYFHRCQSVPRKINENWKKLIQQPQSWP